MKGTLLVSLSFLLFAVGVGPGPKSEEVVEEDMRKEGGEIEEAEALLVERHMEAKDLEAWGLIYLRKGDLLQEKILEGSGSWAKIQFEKNQKKQATLQVEEKEKIKLFRQALAKKRLLLLKEIRQEEKKLGLGRSFEKSKANLLQIAESFRGVPYHFGGSTPDAFDCSGFTSYVYAMCGIQLPRQAHDQYLASQKRTVGRPGDLVFFSEDGTRINHVGIYVGEGYFIGAQTSSGVDHASLEDPYWRDRFVSFGSYD